METSHTPILLSSRTHQIERSDQESRLRDFAGLPPSEKKESRMVGGVNIRLVIAIGRLP